MKKQLIILLSLMAALFAGCSDQKATATRQRWMEVKTATDNLIDAMAYANQATSTEAEDALAEPLAKATSTVDACRKYNEALSSQKTVNVDPRLNAMAEKLIESSKVLLTQTQRGQEAIISAQRLVKEAETVADPQKYQQMWQELEQIQQEMNSAQQIGADALMQINNHYQELETLRLELNKQYGFELPQINWMDQQ